MGSITPSKSPGAWRLIVDAGTDPSTNKRRQLTRTFHGGKRAAREAMESWQADLRRATSPGLASRSTYADLHAKWIGHQTAAGQAGNTLVQKRSIFRLYLAESIGPLPLADLRVEHLDDLYHALLTEPQVKGRPISASYVLQIHTQIKATLRRGVAWGWAPANVAELTRAPAIGHRVVRAPSPEAVMAVLGEVKRSGDATLHLWLDTLATTGARPGEVCAITWDRLDLSTGELTLDRSISQIDGAKSTKTGTMRRLHLPHDLLATFRDYRETVPFHAAESYVFGKGDRGVRPWQPHHLSAKLRDHALACGHPDVNPRALRHFVATQLIGSGVDVRTVAGVLGHANPAMTLNVYSAFLPVKGAEALLTLRQARG